MTPGDQHNQPLEHQPQRQGYELLRPWRTPALTYYHSYRPSGTRQTARHRDVTTS